jgi:histidine triad (HIT) family protein
MADSTGEASGDCLFCKIVSGDVPSQKVYEDDAVVSFVDVNPQAPTHVLVVPRTHMSDLVELGGDPDAAGRFVAGIRSVADALGVSDFRTVFNTGAGAQQTVFHLHAHLLAGRPFTWPPG